MRGLCLWILLRVASSVARRERFYRPQGLSHEFSPRDADTTHGYDSFIHEGQPNGATRERGDELYAHAAVAIATRMVLRFASYE